MNLMSAMGGISDRHITEFAYASPKRGRIKLLTKIASAAACLAVITTAAVRIGNMVLPLHEFSIPSSVIIDCWDDPMNENNARVVLNGEVYLFDNDDLSELSVKLRDGFEIVGEVSTVDPNCSGMDGYSFGCDVGDPIYQDPNFPGELYVFTKSFSNEAKYVRFADYETHKLADITEEALCYIFVSIKYNGKLYCTVDPVNDAVLELPEEYALVETIDDDVKAASHDSGAHFFGNIGEQIYQKPGCMGEIYLYYNNKFEMLGKDKQGYIYIRLIDFETFRQEYPWYEYQQEIDKKTLNSEDLKTAEKIDPAIYSNTSQVVVNGRTYAFDDKSLAVDSLPDEYAFIGEVLYADNNNAWKEGYALGFNVGDKIYQNPGKMYEVYVLTDYTDSEEYRFVRCVNYSYSETPGGDKFNIYSEGAALSAYFNDKRYIYDPEGVRLPELPEGYIRIGTITTEDDYYANGYGQCLHIGDEIYQDPSFSGDLYVYSTFVSREKFGYRRLVDAETLKREGKDKHIFVMDFDGR